MRPLYARLTFMYSPTHVFLVASLHACDMRASLTPPQRTVALSCSLLFLQTPYGIESMIPQPTALHPRQELQKVQDPIDLTDCSIFGAFLETGRVAFGRSWSEGRVGS